MASEESRCDALIAQVFGKEAIVRFGRRGKRTTGTKGVPDRAYFVHDVIVWWEVKDGRDRLSDEQRAFLLRVLRGGGAAGCGNYDNLLGFLRIAPSKKDGERLVNRWSRAKA